MMADKKYTTRTELLEWLKKKQLPPPPYDHQTWGVSNLPITFALEDLFEECRKIYSTTKQYDHTIHLSQEIKVAVLPRFGVIVRVYDKEMLMNEDDVSLGRSRSVSVGRGRSRSFHRPL